jgi:hypothetical protein
MNTKTTWTEPAPPKFLVGDQDAETKFATRSPFQAYQRALELGHGDPGLWAAVKGSAFEGQYRARFSV